MFENTPFKARLHIDQAAVTEGECMSLEPLAPDVATSSILAPSLSLPYRLTVLQSLYYTGVGNAEGEITGRREISCFSFLFQSTVHIFKYL